MNSSEIIQLLIHYRYIILFPLAAFEGPVISFIVGILVAAGYFNPFAAYIILLFGDFVPDSIYYFIGKYGEKKSLLARYGHKFGLTEERFDVIRHLWRHHSFKTMFMSKLAYGLSTPFLVTAGLAGVPPKKFYSYVLPVTFFQYAALMALGYYFGGSYALISKYVKYAQEFMAVLFILFVTGYFFFAVSLKKKIIKNNFS